MGDIAARLRSVENRLGVVESAVGVDPLAAAACEGDPTSCEGPCVSGACPMRENVLARLSRVVRVLADDHRVFRCLALELEGVHPGVLARAAERAQAERLRDDLADVARTLETFESAGMTGELVDEARKRKSALGEELRRVRANLNAMGVSMLHPLKITVKNLRDPGTTQEVTIRCRHADMWPPAWSKSGGDAESLRAQGLLTDEQYERAKTWERVCGLQEMDAEKCRTCPNALLDNGLQVAPPARVLDPAVSKRKRRKK